MEYLLAMGMFSMILIGAICIFMIIATWFMFEKAGQPGWAILIPIYNVYILIKVANKPWWWIFGILLGMIPFAGSILVLVWSIFIWHAISKNFGKEVGFTVGLVLLTVVFLPILAFGDAKYKIVE